MTERMAWRRAVERSRLPNGVKLTLLKHSEWGSGHWHDEERNEHAYPQARLADRLDSNVSTIRRHYQRARSEGYLVMHELGHRGQGQRTGRAGGHMTVFHYVTPSEPVICETCHDSEAGTPEIGAQAGVEIGTQSADGLPCSNYPQSADQDARPIEDPQEAAPRYESRAAIVAAIRRLGSDLETGNIIEDAPASPGSQRSSGDRSAATGPAAGLNPETGLGPIATTGGPPCRACCSQPSHLAHPTCDADAAAESVDLIAMQLDTEQWRDTGLFPGRDGEVVA